MFTGIIAQQGSIRAIVKQKNMIRLSVDLGSLAAKVRLGDSVSISGTCLTAVAKKSKLVDFDVMKETLINTTLGGVRSGDHVNLELALTPQTRMGGHVVTGHVDEVAIIKKIVRDTNWVAITISVSTANQRYVVPKGSITVDGISLTVGRVTKGSFEVYLIPLTLSLTTLGKKIVGDSVNLETDVLAKYVLAKR